MRHLIKLASLTVALGLIGAGSAFAGGGGMGDPSTVIREKNAICEMQRRGQGPLSPNMCLPELPPGPVYESRSNRQ